MLSGSPVTMVSPVALETIFIVFEVRFILTVRFTAPEVRTLMQSAVRTRNNDLIFMMVFRLDLLKLLIYYFSSVVDIYLTLHRMGHLDSLEVVIMGIMIYGELRANIFYSGVIRIDSQKMRRVYIYVP